MHKHKQNIEMFDVVVTNNKCSIKRLENDPKLLPIQTCFVRQYNTLFVNLKLRDC